MTLASDQKLDDKGLSATSRHMLALREQVFAEWEHRVRASLEEASKLPHPILIDTLPAFYDNIAESLTPDYPRVTGTESSNLATDHGGERARITSYDHEALVDEYQLFRSVIFDVLYRERVGLSPPEVIAINASIDAGIKEAVAGFAAADRVLRERFAAALTHDLRGPLGATSSALDLIVLVDDLARIRTLAVKAKDNVRRMDGMISELLDTMAFHSGEQVNLRLSHFDIAELIKEVHAASGARSGKIVLACCPPADGWWDRSALQRVLENILNNALKYGRTDTPVTISVRCAHGRLALTIHNEGEAIPATEIDTIFQMFRRVESQEVTRKQGWGIGLPYVRAVAESHGGSVIVDSTAERGTSFTLDLPLDCRPFVNHASVT